MPNHSSLAIANQFLDLARAKSRPLTHMHLQKLVYLAHGWTLSITGRPLIEDSIEAWEFGPVVRKLYDALKRYGRHPVTRPILWGDDTPFESDDAEEARPDGLTANERGVIEKVWELYGKYDAFQLSALTHQRGSPWEQTYEPAERGRNGRIDDEKIREYFVGLAGRAA